MLWVSVELFHSLSSTVVPLSSPSLPVWIEQFDGSSYERVFQPVNPEPGETQPGLISQVCLGFAPATAHHSECA